MSETLTKFAISFLQNMIKDPMSEPSLKFALFGNIYQEKKSAAVQKILSVLSERDARLAIDEPFLHFLRDKVQINLPDFEIIRSDDFEADFAICMGGDGTFLNVANRVGTKQIPILGFNTGRLGFLASFLPDDIEAVVENLYAGNYSLESHRVLQLCCEEQTLSVGSPYALNEIALLKHDISSMISIHTSINGEYLTTYQADGLIIGTPTGSTAYSLSVGGPIVMPQCHAITLTPVAPHSLNMRPIVLTDDCEVELKVESRSRSFLIAIDGRSHSQKDNVHLIVRRAPHEVRVVKRPGQTFFDTLCKKMMWGVDQRI